MNSYSQLDFIAGRRWERALFTTYALSLTFFETYLLPQLRKAGCEQIFIMVDVDGYRGSLMELKSRHVGQEYSLIPVQCKSGIFHPKVTYLWGAEGDLLMVGSGNLTFGGHGRNVEVLEVLQPDGDADAFVDFSGFLEELEVAEAISFPNSIDLAAFSNRALKVAEGQSAGKNTRLLHTLSEPISSQLQARAGEVTGWNELLVLSPFHHPEAAPIRELAETLGIKQLTIGVPPNSDEPTSFPFSEAAKWDVECKIVTPKVEQIKRPLHAKWIELRGNQNWALTGSVNATAQSLTTTKNVEVGVLRVLDKASHELWKGAKKPDYTPCQMDRAETSSSPMLYAEMDSNGHVRGRFLGAGQFEGIWSGYLDRADELLAEDMVDVGADGTFDWPLTSFSEFQDTSSLQIRLIREKFTARGWVSIQSLLRLPSRTRGAINALSRMLNRSESLDDIHALLDFISVHAGRVATVSSQISGNSSNKPKEEKEDFKFSVSDLSSDGGLSHAGLFRELASSAADEGRSWHVLQTITKLLLGKKQTTQAVHSTYSQKAVAGKLVEDEDDAKVLEQTKVAIDEFNSQVNQLIEGAQNGKAKLAQLLFVWLNVNLDMYLRRLNDVDGAFAVVEKWVRRVARANIPADAHGLLDESFAGAAAALASRTKDAIASGHVYQGFFLSKALVHQWMESYFSGEVDKVYVLEKAKSWFAHETAELFVNGNPNEALEALASCLEVPTIRGVLSSMLVFHRLGGKPEIPAGMFSIEEEAQLKQAFKSASEKPAYRMVNHHTIKGCPKCYVSLIKDTNTRLSTRRMAECMNCKTLLVSLEP